MTGVIEVAAASAAIAVFARNKHEKERQEERVASELYKRFFNADLCEESPDRATIVGNLVGVDVNAVAAVRAIERYQKERRHRFMYLSSSAEHVGDTRTRVLEELKQWLMTLSMDAAISAGTVANRLDYCSQFLLRAPAFEAQNEISFLATLGEVCRHLERLFQQTVSLERTGEAKIGHLLSLGKELVEATKPVLRFSLFAPQSALDEADAALPDFDLSTAGGRLVAALLREVHFRRLGDSPGELEGSTSPGFPELLEETSRSWLEAPSAGQDSGLLVAFAQEAHVEARKSFLDLCRHLDRFCFFLMALQPYQKVAAAGGDAALCWLRRGLCHLLQELGKALLQLRQARLAVLHASKKHLQELAKQLPKSGKLERRWMQDLRHIDDQRLDELHKILSKGFAEVQSMISAAREVELKSMAKQGLQNIASAFLSADFQARCSLALPDRLAAEMRELASGVPVGAVGVAQISS
ncbi:scrn3 [Symbiodinium natans]|uniref:Scrn3 protein n=1 Tax=Symbiodinium natans TaxID=878477 RepID=A0A812RWG1_9DINO|nr:scrn3 [Symbiodinium natans]